MNKSSLIIFDKIICRTPVFPLECIFDKEWGFLKQLIKDSSPEFYRIIKGLDASEIESQPFKVRYTIWKYWNRARYRATPFGRFAALTLLPVNSSRDDDPIHVSSKMNYKEFVSWKNISHLDLSAKSIQQNATCFFVNTSFYVVGNEIRYIYNDNGTFQLTSVELQDTLLRVLQHCSTKRTKSDVNHFISELLQLSESETDELVEQLIDMQLLFTDRQPNIIGRDYFQRIGHSVNEGISTHTISERTLISGGIPRRKIERLKELIPLLSRILPITDDTDLVKFKNSFLKHYEHRLEVPLLEALDPEIGIGYLTLDNRPSESQLVNEILSSKEEVEVFPEVVYSELHRFLLQNLDGKEPIRLEQITLGKKKDHDIRLPNTFSVVLQVTENFVVLNQVGGASAAAMAGRFTLLNESFESLGREIASFEEDTNSNVFFFDIAYSADNQVDDVNRRKHLYKFELPILTWNEGQDGLELNDIMISVVNDQIVLRSKKYNKRLVPRLATAYNYKRSELSVFRFLSDLQHQGLQTNLTLNIETLLPYLNYYPRVMYKDIVVSPSKWLIPERFYGNDQSEFEKLQELKKWLTKCEINQPFLCGRSDQKLCFDPREVEDLLFFLQFIKDKERLYIEESFLHGDSVVKDETNRSYLSEFVVNFGHTVPFYSTDLSSRGMDSRSESNSQRMQFMQGSE